MNLTKSLAFTLILSSLFSFELKADDINASKFKGTVKQVETTEYTPGSFIKKLQPINTLLLEFNKNGDVVLEELKGDKGQLITSTRSAYNNNSKVIDYALYTDKGSLDGRTISEIRNSDGAEVSVKYYNAEGFLISKAETLFLPNGKINTITQFDVRARPLVVQEYIYNGERLDYIRTKDSRIKDSSMGDILEFFEYDEDGNVVVNKRVTADGGILNYTHYSYKDGKKVKSIEYPTLDITNLEKTVTLYNKFGDILEVNYYDSNENVFRQEKFIRGNYKGSIKEYAVLQDYDGKLLPDFVQEFDDLGNELKRVAYSPEGKIVELVTIDYVKDSEGNWIEKVEKNNQVLEQITKRTITYF